MQGGPATRRFSIRPWLGPGAAACLLLLGGCSSTPSLPLSGSDGDRVAADSLISPAVIGSALAMVGAPYRYGGDSPRGFDCSGLVSYAYARAGVSVPRTTEAQYRSSQGIGLAEAREGDLLFFRIQSQVSHVAIYLGNGRFVHAPSTGKDVSIGALSEPYWRERFVGARRFGQS